LFHIQQVSDPGGDLSQDEVGMVVGDADVVDAAPLARVSDRLDDRRAAVLQQQPVALGQAIRLRPDAVPEERMLGRGPDRPARDPQLPQEKSADRRHSYM